MLRMYIMQGTKHSQKHSCTVIETDRENKQNYKKWGEKMENEYFLELVHLDKCFQVLSSSASRAIMSALTPEILRVGWFTTLCACEYDFGIGSSVDGNGCGLD